MSHNIRQAVWYLLPSSLIFLIFYYWPLLQNIYLSFFSWNMVSPTMKYVGVENYWKILNSAELGKIILNTVLFVVILLVFNFILPYLYSYILGHLIQKGRAFYRRQHSFLMDLQPSGRPLKHHSRLVRRCFAPVV